MRGCCKVDAAICKTRHAKMQEKVGKSQVMHVRAVLVGVRAMVKRC
jgi:hypothetical protein